MFPYQLIFFEKINPTIQTILIKIIEIFDDFI
jgi:hypothetical protein